MSPALENGHVTSYPWCSKLTKLPMSWWPVVCPLTMNCRPLCCMVQGPCGNWSAYKSSLPTWDPVWLAIHIVCSRFHAFMMGLCSLHMNGTLLYICLSARSDLVQPFPLYNFWKLFICISPLQTTGMPWGTLVHGLVIQFRRVLFLFLFFWQNTVSEFIFFDHCSVGSQAELACVFHTIAVQTLDS